MPEIIILAIESSCDDTSAAICVDGKVVSNLTANQHVHEQFGGVIPELASREHTKNIIPVVAVFWGILDGEQFQLIHALSIAGILAAVVLIRKG